MWKASRQNFGAAGADAHEPTSGEISSPLLHRRGHVRYNIRNESGIDCQVHGAFVSDSGEASELIALAPSSSVNVALKENAGSGDVHHCSKPIVLSFKNAKGENVKFDVAITEASHQYMQYSARSFIVVEIIITFGRVQATIRSSLCFINCTPFTLHVQVGEWSSDVAPNYGNVTAATLSATGIPMPTLMLNEAGCAWQLSKQSSDPNESALVSKLMEFPICKEPMSFQLALKNSEKGEAVAVVVCTVVPSYVPHSNLIGERIITFQTPMEIQNLMPYAIKYVFCDSHQRVLEKGELTTGGCAASHCAALGYQESVFFAFRMESLQGRVLQPRDMLKLETGELSLIFSEFGSDDERSMRVLVLVEQGTLSAYRLIVYAPYVIYCGLRDRLRVYKGSQPVPGTMTAAIEGATQHEFIPVAVERVHPALECYICHSSFDAAVDKVVCCKTCSCIAHAACSESKLGTPCFIDVAGGLPQTAFAEQTIMFAPPEWDPFGGKLKFSLGGSDITQTFPYDTVNLSGCIACSESIPAYGSIPARRRIRCVGIMISVAPGQFLRSKCIVIGPFIIIKNTSDRKLLLRHWEQKFIICELAPSEEKEVVYTFPAEGDAKALVEKGEQPQVFIEVIDGSFAGARSTPFQLSTLGRTPLKLQVADINNPGMMMSMVLGVRTEQYSMTLRVCVEHEIIPPIRIANNTWSTVEFKQDLNDKATAPAVVDRVGAFQTAPYFFQEHSQPNRIIIRTLRDGMVVRIRPSALGGGEDDEDYEVLEKGSGKLRVTSLVGYDAVVVAIEEHVARHKLCIENLKFKDLRGGLREGDLKDVKSIRVAIKYNGMCSNTHAIKQAGTEVYDFKAFPPLHYDVFSSRDAVRFVVELQPLAVFSMYGVCQFAIGKQKANRGTCTLEVSPPPDEEDTTPVGTLSFSWVFNTTLTSDLDETLDVSDVNREIPYILHVNYETSIGVSFVGRNGLRQVEEACLHFSDLAVLLAKRDNDDMDVELLMSRLQLDNQRGSAIFPVVLSTPDVEKPQPAQQPSNAPADTASDQADDDVSSVSLTQSATTAGTMRSVHETKRFKRLQQITRKRGKAGKKTVLRFLHGSAVQINSGVGITRASYGGLSVQEMILTLDDIYLIELMKIFPQYLLRADVDNLQQSIRDLGSFDVPFTGQGAGIESRVFMQFLQLHPLLLNLTYLSARESSDSGGPFMVLLHTIGMAVQNIDRAPLRVNALLLTNLFGQKQEVTSIIQQHFVTQIIMEFYKVLGAVEFLGNPTQLLSSIGEGIYDLFYEPAMGLVQSPKEFAKGLVRGVSSLLRHTVSGVCSTIKGITRTLANGFAAATFDEDWQRERRKRMRQRPRHIGEGLTQAAGHFGRGIIDGVTGLFLKPYEGAKKEGAVGFLKGLGKGFIGLVTKPIAGALDMISTTTDAIRQSLANEYDRLRIRPPRTMPGNLITSYDFESAAVFETLVTVNSGKYSDDVYVFHHHAAMDTYIVSDQRLICTKLKSDDMKWSVSYPSVLKVTDAVTPTNGIVLTVAVEPTWVPFQKSELTVECRTPKEASALLYHMKQQYAELSYELQFVTAVLPSYDEESSSSGILALGNAQSHATAAKQSRGGARRRGEKAAADGGGPPLLPLQVLLRLSPKS